MATSETSSVKDAAVKETIVKLVLDDQAALNTASVEEDLRLADSVTLVTVAGAGVASGAVTLEAAMSTAYAGTWQSLGAVTLTGASRILSKTIDLSDDPNPIFPFVRARISTIVVGGTIDVYLIIRR
jgi:hypothetical protein